jgi:HD-GYP domain-containing protein (c-di-GMP phosphodiesterase class II)
MTETLSQYFRPITKTFLEKSWGESFALYYKVDIDGDDQHLKFADYSPDVHKKLLKIMDEDNHQELFVHEDDLLKYFKRALVGGLRKDFATNNPGPEQAVARFYPVAARILNEYFENKTSEKILRTLDDLPEILIPIVKEKLLPFPAVYKLTQKKNMLHTHCLNVGLYCMNLGMHLKLNENDLAEILLGGMLADCGKKFIPQGVLMKKGALTDLEVHHVRKHPSAGRKLLSDMKCYPETVLAMASEHHENFDGSGYPSGKSGEAISLGGRICRIMDTFNSLTSERSYRKAINPASAISMIKKEMTDQVDENLLNVFIMSIDPK